MEANILIMNDVTSKVYSKRIGTTVTPCFYQL